MGRMIEILDIARQANDDLCMRFHVPTNHMPLAALNMASNRIIMTLELMEYYDKVFEKPQVGRLEDNLVGYKEEGLRLSDLLNSCFILVMSSMEYCGKKAAKDVPEYLGSTPKYLINIIQKSRKSGWINKDDEIMWDNMIKIRNFLVHNNGESQGINDFELPGGIIWLFRPGVQSKVTLRHIPACLEWVIKSYAEWCSKLLECWSESFDFSPKWNKFYSYEIVTFSGVLPVWGYDAWSHKGTWGWGDLIRS